MPVHDLDALFLPPFHDPSIPSRVVVNGGPCVPQLHGTMTMMTRRFPLRPSKPVALGFRFRTVRDGADPLLNEQATLL